MELTPDLQIRAVIKALTDTVLPAVDPDNAIAREQGQLAVALLGFVAARLPLAYDYARKELTELAAQAKELLALEALDDAPATAADCLATLGQAGETAAELLARAGADPAALEAAARDIRAAISALVDALAPDPETQDARREQAAAAVNRVVLAGAAAQLTRERAWLAPLGVEWEQDIPEVSHLIGQDQAEPAA